MSRKFNLKNVQLLNRMRRKYRLVVDPARYMAAPFVEDNMMFVGEDDWPVSGYLCDVCGEFHSNRRHYDVSVENEEALSMCEECALQRYAKELSIKLREQRKDKEEDNV